jgi:hypothetical protein
MTTRTPSGKSLKSKTNTITGKDHTKISKDPDF